jgi:hypothetical protein
VKILEEEEGQKGAKIRKNKMENSLKINRMKI